MNAYIGNLRALLLYVSRNFFTNLPKAYWLKLRCSRERSRETHTEVGRERERAEREEEEKRKALIKLGNLLNDTASPGQ